MDNVGRKDRWAISRRQEPAATPTISPLSPSCSEDPRTTQPGGPKATILVIEDEPPLQKFLRVTLTSHNYKVIEALNGESGLRHASNDQPDRPAAGRCRSARRWRSTFSWARDCARCVNQPAGGFLAFTHQAASVPVGSSRCPAEHLVTPLAAGLIFNPTDAGWGPCCR